MGFEDAPPIPLLQGIGSSAYELAELFRRICVVHTYVLLSFNMFVNTVHSSSFPFPLILLCIAFYLIAGEMCCTSYL